MNNAGAPIAAYTWGAAGLVSEHRFATTVPTTQNAQSLWHSYGPQGETRALTNSAGTVADTYVYYAYGYPIASTGSDPNPFRYGGSVGYYTDPAAEGLVLCGQRWYAPGYARWLSRDPEGYGGGANLYAYCGDNPVGGVDPSGLDDQGTMSWGAEWSQAWREGTKNFLNTVQKAPADWVSQIGEKINNFQATASAFAEAHMPFMNGNIPGGVYALTDENGNIMYVGRSIDIAQREKQWAKDPVKGGYKLRTLVKCNDPDTVRGLEQHFYDEYHPPLNKIRPISLGNKNFGKYMTLAEEFLNHIPKE